MPREASARRLRESEERGGGGRVHRPAQGRGPALAQHGRRRFPGPLYPIHPSASEVLGHKTYRSLRELPEAVDLAVVLVRPDLVPGVIDDCAELAVPAVIVITAGFGETGAAGKALEQRLAERLRAAGGA